MVGANEREDWVLITGGSHGIGKALAQSFYDRNYAVAIVALPDRHLTEYIEQHGHRGAKSRVLGLDLTEPTAVKEIMAWLSREAISVKYLVNNVGFGRGGLVENTPWAEYAAMLRLNNQVMVELTLALLPTIKRRRGGILNLSSMEATLPLPYKTVYTGTKAFVYSFSLALRQEMRYYGVNVTVLCPGPVITNEDGLKRVEAMGKMAKVLITLPEDIAPPAVEQFLAGKDVIRPHFMVRAILAVAYVVPRQLKMRILEKLFSKYRATSQAEPQPVEVTH